MEKTATKRFSTKTMVLCGMFTALTASGAFIQVPVPYMDYFTLQFFFVLMAGLVLGGRLGATAVGCYVLLGLAGLPVFAAGGGIDYVLRPSFGYLLGFIASAFVTGWLSERLKTNNRNYFLACLAGLVVTYGIGIVYKYMILNFYIGTVTAWTAILMSCFPLDLPGDFVLCILASGLGVRLKKSSFYIEERQGA